MIKMPNPSREPPASSKAPDFGLKDIWYMGITKTCDYIHVMIKMPNPSQEHSMSSKAANEDSKDMDVLCTFKINIESQNLEYG